MTASFLTLNRWKARESKKTTNTMERASNFRPSYLEREFRCKSISVLAMPFIRSPSSPSFPVLLPREAPMIRAYPREATIAEEFHAQAREDRSIRTWTLFTAGRDNHGTSFLCRSRAARTRKYLLSAIGAGLSRDNDAESGVGLDCAPTRSATPDDWLAFAESCPTLGSVAD